MNTNELIAVSPAKAAEMLDVSRPFIYRYLTSGELPSFHMGRSRKILVKDLAHFAEHMAEEQQLGFAN